MQCNDEGDDGIKFEGIHLRTPDNLDMGTIGKRDLNDWGNDGSLSEAVLTLLEATPDHDITGTDNADINIIGGYPNPVKHSFTFQANVTGGPCLFEYVIVNEKMNVLFSGSNVGNDQMITFDVSDPDKFPTNKVIRMYYSFSKDGDRNFYAGHGDILICRSSKCPGII
jgi:hypothetical protein